MKSPKVTVITGYYNRGHALDETIDSIMNQSFHDFEFIIFNDKSTDDTEERLQLIENKYNDPRIIIINHLQNKGFVQGMIEAIQMAKGEYICVQGSGDTSYPERLKQQVALLNETPDVGVVGCFYENYVEDKNITRTRRIIADGINLEQLIKGNVYSHGEVMYRKEIYHQVGGYRAEFENCQDLDLWLRMVQVSNLATVQNILYTRFIRFDGVSYSPNKFLKQIRYSVLCQDLASLSDESQKDILTKVRKEGIEKTVSIKQKRIQVSVIKAAFRSLAWGNKEAAINLARTGISNSIIKVCSIGVFHLYSSWPLTPVRSQINKILGITQ